jgi:hypothetical protein
LKKFFDLKVFLGLLVLGLISFAFWYPAAAKAAVPMKGSVHVNVTYRPDFPNMLIYIQGDGTGNATHLGKFTVHYEVVLNLQTQVGTGTAIIVAANGDQLFTDNVGTVAPTGNPNENQIVETYTITGGTGRFEGASGQFGGTRLVDTAAGISWGSFEGEIVRP